MVGLKALLSASLCISWLWTARTEAVKKLHQGESGFWVQLKTISSPDGKLQPAFLPNRNDYKLIVDDAQAESIQIALTLMLDHYYPDEPPKIHVDGKELLYNPFKRISFDIPVGRGIAGLDRLVEVRISDPKSHANMLGQGKTENTYNIRVIQGPILDKMVVPTYLKVTDPSGKELEYTENSKKFTLERAASDDPSDKTFQFSLLDQHAEYVEVDMGCPQFQNVQIILNGETEAPYKVGEKLRVNMLGSFRREVQVECVYEDERWSPSPVSNAFVFIFSTHIEDKKLLEGKLVTPADYGHCEEDDDLDHKRWADYKGEKSKDVDHGYICRVVGKVTPLISLLPSPKVTSELTLTDGKSKPVKTGIKVEVPTEHLRDYMTYTVRAGDLTAHYPVLLLRLDNGTSLPRAQGTDSPAQAIQRHTIEQSGLVGATMSSSERLLQLSLVVFVASMALFLAAFAVHRRSRLTSHRAISCMDGLLDE